MVLGLYRLRPTARARIRNGGSVVNIELRGRDRVEVIWPLKKEARGNGRAAGEARAGL
jgi:hypothetical protein